MEIKAEGTERTPLDVARDKHQLAMGELLCWLAVEMGARHNDKKLYDLGMLMAGFNGGFDTATKLDDTPIRG